MAQVVESTRADLNVRIGLMIPCDGLVVVSAGGKYSCYLAMLATCSPGDEVVIAAPYWVSYPEMAKLAGATPRFVLTADTTGFKLSPAQLEQAILTSGLPVVVNRIGSMLTPFFTDGPVSDYASATRSDTAAYGRLARSLLDAGVYPPPSQFEAWFTGLTHGPTELAHTREALRRAAATD